MSCSRRDFLKNSAQAAFVSSLPLSAFVVLTTEEAKGQPYAGVTWSIRPSAQVVVCA
jgi:anaerobic selenocysteine-containing dehydrogenase